MFGYPATLTPNTIGWQTKNIQNQAEPYHTINAMLQLA